MPEQPKRFINNDGLKIIRDHTDWRQLFLQLGLEQAKKGTPADWWALSPLSTEKTASFHINDKGWYCHSTGQGGGIIELVQKVIGYRSGQTINCYQAGHWLIDNGLSVLDENEVATTGPQGHCSPPLPHTQRSEKRKENIPIRQTLVPLLDMAHPEITQRGISKSTCQYLGCGHLSSQSKSPLANRIVFQVRGIENDTNDQWQPNILTHIGRAMTDEQKQQEGKWRPYSGFYKTLELYNIDKMILDDQAILQAQQTGHIIVVEGCWDVAKLIEAGIFNVVATFWISPLCRTD